MNWVRNITKSWRNKMRKQIHKETNDSICIAYMRCYTFSVDLEPPIGVLGGYIFWLKFLILPKYTYVETSTPRYYRDMEYNGYSFKALLLFVRLQMTNTRNENARYHI